MCGRTHLSLVPERIRESTGTKRWVDQQLYRPSYNVAPTRYQPVIVRDAAGDKFLRCHKWGFVPPWSKQLIINARDDSLVGPNAKKSFNSLKNTKRCVVIAEGFFEWDKSHGSVKVPFYVHPNRGEMHLPSSATLSSDDKNDEDEKPHDLLFMAGLWDTTEIDGETVHTYTIVTTASSPSLSFLHDRMPVLLSPSSLPTGSTYSTALDIWLDTTLPISDPLVSSLLRPYEGPGISWHAVSVSVSSIQNDLEENVKPAKVEDVVAQGMAKKAKKPEKGLQNIAAFFKGGKGQGAGTPQSKGSSSAHDSNESSSVQAHDPADRPSSQPFDFDELPASPGSIPLKRKRSQDADSEGPDRVLSTPEPARVKSEVPTSGQPKSKSRVDVDVNVKSGSPAPKSGLGKSHTPDKRVKTEGGGQKKLTAFFKK